MEVDTLTSLFLNTVEQYPKADALRAKQGGAYRDISSASFLRSVRDISAGLRTLGLDRGDRVALCSPTRAEWLIADLGILCAGCVTVPIYPSLPPDVCEHILKDSGARAVFVATPDLLEKVREVRDECPNLARSILFDGEGGGNGELTLDALRERGAATGESEEAFRERALAARPEDTCTLIYTSGTTGMPKGVILVHRNLVSNVKAALEVIPLSSDDTALSFLPLAHILEKMLTYVLLYRGATIAYAESFETVPQNMMEVRPTMVAGVPRFFEKVYERVQANREQMSAGRRRLFDWAVGVGRAAAERRLARGGSGDGGGWRLALANALVFRKVKARTGGRIRFFVSGGAPLSKEITLFFLSMGMDVLEGYGLTETSPVIAVNTPDALRPGTVGRPVPGVDVRIAEDGEILCRGPNVMKGYYGLPEATEEALKDGWFHTGDIGEIDGDGFLKITDRKKDLIKTSGGKYVAPQPIENRLKLDPYIVSAVVVGNRRKFVSVLLVPDFEKVGAYARKRGADFVEHRELLKLDVVRELLEDRLADANKGLASFEQVKKFALLDRDFSIDAGEITPTMKVKRRVVEDRYRKVIDGLYEP
ncbi:MAG: long-chain fatty acid--CoA ligase [Candidatus Eisenbacteria bacterium]